MSVMVGDNLSIARFSSERYALAMIASIGAAFAMMRERPAAQVRAACEARPTREVELEIAATLMCRGWERSAEYIFGQVDRVARGRLEDTIFALNLSAPSPAKLASLDMRPCSNNLVLPRHVVLGFRRAGAADNVELITADGAAWQLVTVDYAPVER